MAKRHRNRNYPMGVCLLHKRPVGYKEGRFKGCVSRRRCKWFRGPWEPATEVSCGAVCPALEEEKDGTNDL